MKNFNGKVLFLDRSDINTDEIIPAKYLNESTKAALKPYCLEDLLLPGFDPKRDVPGHQAVITRANFGCGSSREHAPWVLGENGINVVVAENFARIFRQNMFNCGMLAIELPAAAIAEIFDLFGSSETTIEVALDKQALTLDNGKISRTYKFELDPFDLELVKAGGWVAYADSRY